MLSIDDYHPDCRSFLEELGVSPGDAGLAKLRVEPMSYPAVQRRTIPSDVLRLVKECANRSLQIDADTFDRLPKERVTRLRR
jgi:hypothetical protein